MAESYGWAGKILRVNLTTGEITTQDDAKYHKYIGGMGMAYRIMYEEAPMELDPYDEKALVIFGVGPLTGAGVPCSGRMNVTFRSTWSKGRSIIDAHMGGHIGSMLKYAGYDGIVVSGISEKPVYLRIEDGEFVFLVGPSGSGKSTIIKLLTGEITPTEGQIAVNGFSLTNIAERQIPLLRRSIGIIFQDFRLIEKKTVYENLSFAMRAVGSSPREIKKRIPYVLELVGLEEKTDRYPNEISGGEQQRVAIARALINNPSTIIADEPTGNLDPARSLEIMRLLERINHLGTTMVVVTHEKDLVNQFKKRVVTLDQGLITSDGDGVGYNAR